MTKPVITDTVIQEAINAWCNFPKGTTTRPSSESTKEGWIRVLQYAWSLLPHLRPTIEAQSREAALREAAAICQRENWDDAAENAILALIAKELEA
jgi:hypothetical protein